MKQWNGKNWKMIAVVVSVVFGIQILTISKLNKIPHAPLPLHSAPVATEVRNINSLHANPAKSELTASPAYAMAQRSSAPEIAPAREVASVPASKKSRKAHSSRKSVKTSHASAKAVKLAKKSRLEKKTKTKVALKTSPVVRRPTAYLEPVKVARNSHRAVTLTRQNSMTAIERAASRAADESYQENSLRRQVRRDSTALSTAHVSGTFEEE